MMMCAGADDDRRGEGVIQTRSGTARTAEDSAVEFVNRFSVAFVGSEQRLCAPHGHPPPSVCARAKLVAVPAAAV